MSESDKWAEDEWHTDETGSVIGGAPANFVFVAKSTLDSATLCEDSRITNAVADAVAHYRRIGLEPHPLIVGGRVVDILRGRTPTELYGAAESHVAEAIEGLERSVPERARGAVERLNEKRRYPTQLEETQ